MSEDRKLQEPEAGASAQSATITPELREALRRDVMAEFDARMPITKKRFHEWRDWPGTWAFADAAVSVLVGHPKLTALTTPPAPIDMVLHCPSCHVQHIDAPEPGKLISGGPNAGRVRQGWTNPPHRSHFCHGCGYIWRPADVPTNGVQAIKTRGKNDSPLTAPAAPEAVGERKPSITLKLPQARELVEFFGGDEDAEVTISQWTEGHDGPSLYAWCTDYPEEGSVVLDGNFTPSQAMPMNVEAYRATNQVLGLLVAAGHITREKAFQCRDIWVQCFAATPLKQEGAEPVADRDAAIRMWHKHCDPFASLLGVTPSSVVINAMLEFARSAAQEPAPQGDKRDGAWYVVDWNSDDKQVAGPFLHIETAAYARTTLEMNASRGQNELWNLAVVFVDAARSGAKP